MSRELEKRVALVVYANTVLQGRRSDFILDPLITENCYSLEFIEKPPNDMAGATRLIASDASRWVDYLLEQEAKQVRLLYRPTGDPDFPDHISSAFVGGGSIWIIEVQSDRGSDLYADAKFLDTYLPKAKSQYVRFERGVHHLANDPSVDDARTRLNDALTNISEFAGRYEHLTHWADIFNRARKCLTTYEPPVDDFLLPFGILPKKALQLIRAAFGSWVFGGMGSWNDVAFSGEAGYECSSLTDALYEAVCVALMAGANGLS